MVNGKMLYYCSNISQREIFSNNFSFFSSKPIEKKKKIVLLGRYYFLERWADYCDRCAPRQPRH